MARNPVNKENVLSAEELAARKKAQELKANASRIANQILVLTRNGLFVSLRFLDVALTQFKYLPSEAIDTIATSGEYLIYNPGYIIERYMQDKQALSRDYLHIVLHCIFRHPFVSEKLNERYWNLACDIAVEGIINELDVRQARTRNSAEIEDEINKIRKLVKQMTAEYIYSFLMKEETSQKDIARWEKLFKRDDHNVWWEIARKIAEEMRRRAEEEKQSDREKADEPKALKDDENLPDEEAASEDSEDAAEVDDDENQDEDASDESAENGTDSEDEIDENDETENDGEDEESDATDIDEDEQEETEPEEGDIVEENVEDEYSSTPGDQLDGEDDGEADPESETEDTGEEGDGDGSGGGNPGDDAEQSEEEGSERPNETPTDDLTGSDENDKQESDKKPDNNMEGQSPEGQRDEQPDENIFDDQNNKRNTDPSGNAKEQKGKNSQNGEHTAGTGGGGAGTQEAWEHEFGADKRSGGDKDDENRRQLDGEINPNSEREDGKDDGRLESAEPTRGEYDEETEQDNPPSYMHNDEEQRELEDKWKDISERLLVDLETSSKEWGDKSDSMLMGIKKINRDKYDYATFLRKFSTLREDIQINDDEFDYIYYTYGMNHYRNIPLIEPLEYKEVRKVRDFVIAIDTSGSCAGEVVQKFLDKTYSIFSQQENFFRKINLHIIQCDAEIQSDIKITDKQAFDDYMKDIQFRGFGGTDFRPVFEYVDYLIENNEFDDLKGLIYFTDGNGTYPKHRPPYETAFVFVDDDEFDYEVPSWAMKLVLETGEIMDEIEL